jgi:putative Mg2+ transporter-C (MgtC) family protein
VDLSWTEELLRVAVAAVLGAVLGAEREGAGQEAGLRTHVLLSLGAALFGLISVGAFDNFIGLGQSSNITLDPTRVASYVAAGVGFLGAGAIVKYGRDISGLTTAASLWATAAIGLAAGLGYWVPAIATTAVGLLSLTLLRPLRDGLRRARSRATAGHVVVIVRLTAAGDHERVLATLQNGGPPARRVEVIPSADGAGRVVTVELPGMGPSEVTRLTADLGAMPGVASASVQRVE